MHEQLNSPEEPRISPGVAAAVTHEATYRPGRFINRAMYNLRQGHPGLYLLHDEITYILSIDSSGIVVNEERGNAFNMGVLVGNEMVHRQFPSLMSTENYSSIPVEAPLFELHELDAVNESICIVEEIILAWRSYCEDRLHDIFPIIEETETDLLGSHLSGFSPITGPALGV